MSNETRNKMEILKMIRLSNNEILIMVEMDCERWTFKRFLNVGKLRDHQNKISPHLADWEDLPEDIREQDWQAVRAVPKTLNKLVLKSIACSRRMQRAAQVFNRVFGE